MLLDMADLDDELEIDLSSFGPPRPFVNQQVSSTCKLCLACAEVPAWFSSGKVCRFYRWPDP